MEKRTSKCTRCGRTTKNPNSQGYGPTCAKKAEVEVKRENKLNEDINEDFLEELRKINQ